MRLHTRVSPLLLAGLLAGCATTQPPAAQHAAEPAPGGVAAAAVSQPWTPPPQPTASLAARGERVASAAGATAVPVPAPAPAPAPARAASPQATHAGAGIPLGAPERAALDPLPDREEAYAQEVARKFDLPLPAVEAALANARYNATVVRLMTPSSAPPGVRKRSWPAYRARFVEPIRIRHGLAFWQENARDLAEAERRYGVPASVIVAIIGVETVYGRNMGNFRVLDALYTLSFSYPGTGERDRSEYFRGELAEFLAATIRDGIAPEAPLGSYAGAMGMSQFMPSSIRDFGVSTGGRGMPDLANNPRDAVHSVANYLAAHGWRAGQPVFAPVRMPANASALVDGGLEPRRAWAQLQRDGVQDARPAMAGLVSGGLGDDGTQSWQRSPLGVVNLPNDGAGTVEYRLGTPNFFAITHYNRSYFYASAVADLAAELERRRSSL
ncbi:lytic murein transglycosylase B [Verticiella sediminum]|nr:lytic murein transglycosylase B [Verticiella sediminum]